VKVILCSPENFVYLKTQLPPGDPLKLAQYLLDVRVDVHVPTWKTYPRPKWWRRWFLREKQKPPERVFYNVDLDASGFRWPPYKIGPML